MLMAIAPVIVRRLAHWRASGRDVAALADRTEVDVYLVVTCRLTRRSARTVRWQLRQLALMHGTPPLEPWELRMAQTAETRQYMLAAVLTHVDESVVARELGTGLGAIRETVRGEDKLRAMGEQIERMFLAVCSAARDVDPDDGLRLLRAWS